MSDDYLAAVARLGLVAFVAADILRHGGVDLVEVKRIGADSEVIDQLRVVRSLTGQAVRKRMRACSCRNILKGVFMASCASVFLGKSESFIDVHQIGILLQIIGDIAVLAVGVHAGRDIRHRGIESDVFPCQWPQSAPVLYVIHDIRSEDSADHSNGCNDYGDGNQKLDYLVSLHLQTSFESTAPAAEPAGGRITLTGHFAAHLPH